MDNETLEIIFELLEEYKSYLQKDGMATVEVDEMLEHIGGIIYS